MRRRWGRGEVVGRTRFEMELSECRTTDAMVYGKKNTGVCDLEAALFGHEDPQMHLASILRVYMYTR